MTKITKTRSLKKQLLSLFLFPVIVLYFELLFHFTTVKGKLSWNLFTILLFSFAYGTVLYIISALIKNSKIRRRVTAVIIALLAIPYLVEYFIFRQFNILYDIPTVFGGASDAMTGFTKDIFRLIFCFDGLSKIFLFFLPLIVYLFISRNKKSASNINAIKLVILCYTVIICYALSVAVITVHPIYKAKYNEEYAFQDAVSYFGLLNGMHLDLLKLSNKDDVNLKTIDKAEQDKKLEEIAEAEQSSDVIKTDDFSSIVDDEGNPIPNQLNIDFDSLSQNATEAEAELDAYVNSLTASSKNQYTGLFEGKNLIMITAEAFSAQVIDPELTPTLYRLATKGINFNDYYQPASAGTTGGEYQVIFGMIPSTGGMSMKDSADNLNYYTIGSMLDREGYYGKAFHNNSYTYYDRNITHNALGYSDGFMGYGNGIEEYVSNAWPQSDLEMIEGTLPTYIDKDKFNIYYMSVSGHSGYGLYENSMTYKNWSRVEHLDCSDPIKGYLAANLELEDAMAYLVSSLEEAGIADDTVIVLTADHFPYGLDDDSALGDMPYLSELYGYQVTNYMERDKNALIIWSGCLEDDNPIVVNTPVCGFDILPTLANLFGVEFDSRLLPGRDVFSDAMPLAFNSYYDWKTTLGTYISKDNIFIPADETVEIPEGYVDYIKGIVRNKIEYCSGVLENDYFRHVFG